MRLYLFHREKRAFNLRWENINAANYEHIITSPYDSCHANMGATAFARFLNQRAEVACAITD